MNQISENLFTAIDIIIQERLKNLSTSTDEIEQIKFSSDIQELANEIIALKMRIENLEANSNKIN